MGCHSVGGGDGLLRQALERYFAQYYSRHPVNATFTGLHALDDRMPDWSARGRDTEAAEMRRIREELNDTANPTIRQLRTDPIALDGELARANLDVRIAEHDSAFFHARNPALWTGEAIFAVVGLMIREFAPLPERVRSLAARLDAIPAFLDALPEAIVDPVPAAWLARARRECDAADGLFNGGLRAWLGTEDVDPAEVSAIIASADRAREAFARIGAWATAHAAADESTYAAGEALFSTLLSRGHFCAQSPHELLARALAELPVEQERLAAMIAEHGGTWAAIAAAMADDHPTTDAYYETFERRWKECRAIAAAHDAVTWPEWPIRYVPIPAWAQPYAPHLYWLFYRSPAPFDRYDVYDYVVTPIDASMPAEEQERRLRAWNNSTITLNHVVHHGAVGHHVQNWHARHRSKSRVGRIAATDCASRIAMFLGGSMAEGWACYATQLMEELGMLTPLEKVSEQHTRVRMLARAIVDIRLHLGIASFSECVKYYQDVVDMSPDVATAETTKNSMFPCTALMYWLGTSGILALRAQHRAAKGADFTMRAFHDALLSRGAIPVALAAMLMTETAP